MQLQQNPSPFHLLQDKEKLLLSITNLLSSLLKQTSSLAKGQSPFHCKDIPKISIGDYLKRIVKFANCSNAVYVISLIYIDRIQERQELLMLNGYCVHRLLITTIMVAAKYLDDFFYKNEYYSKIGGISKLEVNTLESQLLKVLNYNVFVQEQQFKQYLQRLEFYVEYNAIAPKQ